MSRRNFLKSAALAAVAAGSAGTTQAASFLRDDILPTISLGKFSLSRLIVGWNPIGGHSHFVPNLSKHMLEYYTPDRINEFLVDCEASGINTWQCLYSEKAVEACQFLQKRQSRMKIITVISDFSRSLSLPRVIKETNCFALVHHGNRTDYLLRANQKQRIKDFINISHDLGIQAGVASHCPEHVRMMDDEKWENDFFMCSFYNVTRPDAEQQKEAGKVVFGEPFFVSDPADMTGTIKGVSKPCLAFKILGAGRACYSPQSVDSAFQFAFENIKKTDAVIVGMYPKFSDEIRDNIRLTLKYGL